MNAIMLAQMSGEAAVHLVLYVIVLGVIFWLLFWLVGYCALPAPFDKVARVVLAILAVFVIISVLMGFTGHPIIRW